MRLAHRANLAQATDPEHFNQQMAPSFFDFGFIAGVIVRFWQNFNGEPLHVQHADVIFELDAVVDEVEIQGLRFMDSLQSIQVIGSECVPVDFPSDLQSFVFITSYNAGGTHAGLRL